MIPTPSDMTGNGYFLDSLALCPSLRSVEVNINLRKYDENLIIASFHNAWVNFLGIAKAYADLQVKLGRGLTFTIGATMADGRDLIPNMDLSWLLIRANRSTEIDHEEPSDFSIKELLASNIAALSALTKG